MPNSKTSKRLKIDYKKVETQTTVDNSVFGLEYAGGFKKILTDPSGSHWKGKNRGLMIKFRWHLLSWNSYSLMSSNGTEQHFDQQIVT